MTPLKQYAKLRDKMDKIEEELDTLKVAIMEDMEKQKVKKLESSFGKFTVAVRTNWTYSDKIKTLAQKLKLKKIEEEEKGIAEASHTHYLLFTPLD